MAAEITHAIRGQSLTWDEGDHIFAGYQIWKTHDYGLNPEHPPMVKMLGTIPLLGLDLKVPPLQGRFFKTEAYMDGRELLFRNGAANGGHYEARDLIFRARLPLLFITLTAALLVFCAAHEMFGTLAGFLALILFVFEPNLLAHGAYVTTDMAATCTIFATVYAFWRWTRRPTPARLAVVGLAAGLALAAKHSAVLLTPILVLLSLAELVARYRHARHQSHPSPLWPNALRVAASLAAMVLIAGVVLWSFYGFRYAGRPAGLALSPTLADYVLPLAPNEAHGILLAAKLHLLPESWLYGLADVRAMANGMPSYFFQKVYSHGVWFYFPILFTIKSTIGLLALLTLTIYAIVSGSFRRRRELWFLILPPALYMLVAMQSHLNIGARHILPVWIFCVVLAAGGAAALIRHNRRWTWPIAVLVFLHVASSLRAAPNYIPYANEAWGGPNHTFRYLTDSNTDWGQQLVATSAYLREHNIHHCWFAYFVAPFVLPADYGIPCDLLPTADTSFFNDYAYPVPPVIDGPVLISAGTLNGFEFGSSVLNPYQSFRALTPTAFIQDGVFVFNGSFAVPLASAYSHILASARALKQNDIPTALQEAQLAQQIAPGYVQTESALGDALAAAKRSKEARAAYDRALQKIQTMEPGAREDWTATVTKKRNAL